MDFKSLSYPQEIASALIAGVVVVVVDWKRLLRKKKS